jgi:DNA-binding response OmpR family regulator
MTTIRSYRTFRVLVAEDDPELRKVIADALRTDGYFVIEKADGAAALDYVASCLLHRHPDPPDLVVADIRMPHLSGLHVLAAMRGLDQMPPVVMITAFGDPKTHAQARRLGAEAVFDKPFDVDDLRTVVLNLVERVTRSRPGTAEPR